VSFGAGSMFCSGSENFYRTIQLLQEVKKPTAAVYFASVGFVRILFFYSSIYFSHQDTKALSPWDS
jgi:hypothetical protein